MTSNTDSLKEKLSSDTLREVSLSKAASENGDVEAGKLESSHETGNESQEIEYITGIKLYGVLAALTLAIFLMFLDLSIVATVGFKIKVLYK
jgi:hypothetical protein